MANMQTLRPAAMRALCLLLAIQLGDGLVVRPAVSCSVARSSPRAAPPALFFAKWLEELDHFVDDAVGRRLGNGAAFYGKRRSGFYGEDDTQRKSDPRVADAEEDFSGPSGGSFFLISEVSVCFSLTSGSNAASHAAQSRLSQTLTMCAESRSAGERREGPADGLPDAQGGARPEGQARGGEVAEHP